jgi:HSP20 family protein
MTLTRFTPFRAGINDVAVLQNRLNAIFNDFARPEPSSAETLSMGSFVPAVDIYEDAQKLVLKLEVPGIRPDELDVRIEGRVLTVKGERKFESAEKEENFHRIERRFGSFARSFTLPATVDTDSVAAATADGVLSLALSKKPEAKPKQIEIKVASASSTPRQVESKQVEAKAV